MTPNPKTRPRLPSRDAPPEAGPNTYVVTHGYAEATNPLGYVLGGLGIGIKYDGNVMVPIQMNVNQEIPGTTLEKMYGPSNVFYCGQNGQTAYPWDIASAIVNQNMSQQDKDNQAKSLQYATGSSINWHP